MGGWEIVLQDRVVATFEMAEGDEVVLGRGSDADVVVDNPAVSRRHARIALSGGRVVLEDLGSANGTFVNGKKIRQTTTLGDDDRVEFGKFTLQPARVAGPARTGADLDATVFVKPKPSGGGAGTGPWLEARGGGASPERMALSGKRSVRIGKGSFCDVRLAGWFVVPVQCTLIQRDDGWTVTPGRGLRAVRIGGRKVVGETPLAPGGTFTVAGAALRVF